MPDLGECWSHGTAAWVSSRGERPDGAQFLPRLANMLPEESTDLTLLACFAIAGNIAF